MSRSVKMGWCWKYLPQRESCEYLCGCVDIICPCKKKNHNQSNTSLLLSTDSEVTSIRRISRIDSEESVEDILDKYEETDGCPSSSPPLSIASSGGRKLKKISLRRLATKAIKSYSSPGYSDGEASFDEKEEHGRRNHKILNKCYTTPSEDSKSGGEEIELKQKFKAMLRESRKNQKAHKMKPHIGLPPVLAALPPHPSCQNSDSGKEEGKNKITHNKSYGSTHSRNESESEDNDLSTRSVYETSHPLTPNEDCPSSGVEEEHSFSVEPQIDPSSCERGEGDGADIELGSKENPLNECFGSITVSTKLISPKILSINVLSLQGLPCRQGKDSGICLELNTTPGNKSVWLPLQMAQGSKITVNSEVPLKLPNTNQKQVQEEMIVHVGVWAAGRTWKHCSIGHAIIHVVKSQEVPFTTGLYQHTQLSNNIGIMEVSICSESSHAKRNTPAKLALTVQILRAKFPPEFNMGKLSNTGLKHFKRSKRDIWCRISLWSKGNRIEKAVTPRIYMPVTNDPVFRYSTTFHISRPTLPFTCLVVKVMCDRGLGEDVIGRLVLGPHLYLGVSKGSTPPVALSHWGRAFTHAGAVSMWHKLYL